MAGDKGGGERGANLPPLWVVLGDDLEDVADLEGEPDVLAGDGVVGGGVVVHVGLDEGPRGGGRPVEAAGDDLEGDALPGRLQRRLQLLRRLHPRPVHLQDHVPHAHRLCTPPPVHLGGGEEEEEEG